MSKLLHFDCFSGLSGDMTLAALLDLGVPEDRVQEAVNSLGLPGKLVVQRVRKNGFAAVKITVEAEPEHKHRHLAPILKLLDAANLTTRARDLAKRMFRVLGEAEAASHGIALEKVHFHEVGAVDSLFDFVGIAVGLDWLGLPRCTARPVPTGSGFVQCDHGRLPVPAPAVAHLLRGVPLAPSTIESEMTTPTGAAVLATMVESYPPTPSFPIAKIGIGAGTKDFPGQPNILRLFLGEETAAALPSCSPDTTDTVCVLEANLDDISPEILAYTSERLLAQGAVDVFTTAVTMKKSRPGMVLTVLAPLAQREALETLIFAETGTFGIRRQLMERSKLRRQAVVVTTPWGEVAGKNGVGPAGSIFTPEYEDCARVARLQGVPLREVYETVRRLWRAAAEAGTKP